MPPKHKDLTEAEIWDDSALVDSWNEAYEEYKFYHSIHARGEKVQDVLEAYARGQDEANTVDGTAERHAPTATAPATTGSDPVAGSEDGEIEDGELASEVEITAEQGSEAGQRQRQYQAQQQLETASATHEPAVGVQSSRVPATEALPAQLLASGPQDPVLKNLMMSWYWAGYYSGFYEGQQQAAALSPSSKPGNGR